MYHVILWTTLTLSTGLMLFSSGCTLKGTSKEITDSTSNVTVSTSGRIWFTEDGIVHPDQQLTAFTALNQANLEQDLARGQGEYLTSFGTLLGLTKDQQAAVQAKAQGGVKTLVASDYEAGIQHLRRLIP